MMGRVDQREIIPLLHCQRAKKGMWVRRSGHCLKGGDLSTELVDGGGLIVRGTREPPLGNLDARLHPSLTQNALQDDRAQEFANDPVCAMIDAALGRSQSFSYMLDDLRKVPIPGPVVTGVAQMVNVRQGLWPTLEVQLSAVKC